MNPHTIQSTDVFEIAYLLTVHNFSVDNVTVVPVNKSEVCQFTISGDESLSKAQLEYYNNYGTVKILDFKRAMHRVNTFIGIAKKEYRKQLNEKKLAERTEKETTQGQGGF